MNLHKSVLLKEAIDGLEIQKGDIYLDATVGEGGHLLEVWRRWGQEVILCGIDADPKSIAISQRRLSSVGVPAKLSILNFRNIDQVTKVLNINKPDKILFDLGWSKHQFEPQAEEDKRGFSFQRDEPLVMTYNGEKREGQISAYDVINHWSEESLVDIIYGYGEERYAKRIAQAICKRRQEKPIKTSGELASIVKDATPIFYGFKKIHPATRTFQAIRIAVNDELRALEEGLKKSMKILSHGGRLAVISFHSLEDRIVKNFFKSEAEAEKGRIINKKPITSSSTEVKNNPRARSAKLRLFQKYND